MNFTDLPLDLEALNTLADGDMTFALELLQIYEQDCLPHVQTLRQGIATQDYDRIYDAAHYLVGSSSNIGATQIIDCAKNLETLARAQQAGEYEALLTEIERNLDQINRWLQAQDRQALL
jgi:HPt (histidine-containing phosphotransfer) domain-containing protein